MSEIFIKLFNMSISASYLVAAVILLRLILKKAPKAVFVILWGLVAVRLICPLSFESVASLIPSKETVPMDITVSPEPMIHSGITQLNSVVNPVISETLAPTVGETITPMESIISVASHVWAAGCIAMLIYCVVSYVSLKLKLREAIRINGKIYECDRISSPFIFGVVRPRIYLPSGINGDDAILVIAHEEAHLNRLDHLWKPLGFLLLSVYWFNPLLWVAYILLCRDIELACDEKVVKKLGTDVKKDYSNALINCSIKRRRISACPLAFGETGLRSRIKSILSYKKPSLWIIIASVIICTVVAVMFLTDPPNDEKPSAGTSAESVTQEYGKLVTVNSSYTEADGVTVELIDANIGEDGIYITVKWINDSATDYTFGEMFSLYKIIDEHTEMDMVGDMIFNLLGYGLPAGKEREFTYSLHHVDVSESAGDYIFETGLSKGTGEEFVNYNVHISFTYSEDNPKTVLDAVEYNIIYVIYDSPDPVKTPGLVLYPDSGRATFSYSLLSSYLDMGTYVEDDEGITVNTDDGLNTWYFKKDGENLIFVASASSPIPSYRYSADEEPKVAVPDGAVFSKTTEKAVYPSYFNGITHDIDGDGKDENCNVAYGNTSGNFSIIIHIEGNDILYHDSFIIEPGVPMLTSAYGNLYLEIRESGVGSKLTGKYLITINSDGKLELKGVSYGS